MTARFSSHGESNIQMHTCPHRRHVTLTCLPKFHASPFQRVWPNDCPSYESHGTLLRLLLPVISSHVRRDVTVSSPPRTVWKLNVTSRSNSRATVTDVVAGEFELHVYTKLTRQGCTALPCLFGLSTVDMHVCGK